MTILDEYIKVATVTWSYLIVEAKSDYSKGYFGIESDLNCVYNMMHDYLCTIHPFVCIGDLHNVWNIMEFLVLSQL